MTINEFVPCCPRVSYSQPNISPGVEFRENCRVGNEPTGFGFMSSFLRITIEMILREHVMWMLDPVAIMPTGSPINQNVNQGSPVRSSQTDNVDSPYIATANLVANGNRFHRKPKKPHKFDWDKIKWADYIHIFMWLPVGMVGRTVRKFYSL